MFTWFRERKKFERDTRLMLRAMEFWLQDQQKENKLLMERVDELEKATGEAWKKQTNYSLRMVNQALIEIRADIREIKDVQKTLSDDMYDVQADLTLIHNIEGYEDWRSEIGKPVKGATVSGHAIDCDYHCDQYPWECSCGAVKPVSKPTDIVK